MHLIIFESLVFWDKLFEIVSSYYLISETGTSVFNLKMLHNYYLYLSEYRVDTHTYNRIPKQEHDHFQKSVKGISYKYSGATL